MVQVTYQKRNGDIFDRFRTTYPTYKIGEETSMGWKVLDIKYKWGNKYYHTSEYYERVEKAFKRDLKISRIKNKIIFIYKNAIYIIGLLVLFKVFELSRITYL